MCRIRLNRTSCLGCDAEKDFEPTLTEVGKRVKSSLGVIGMHISHGLFIGNLFYEVHRRQIMWPLRKLVFTDYFIVPC